MQTKDPDTMHAASQTPGTAASLQRMTGLPMPMAQSGAAGTVPVDSHELLRGHKAVEIKHNGSIYRLQTTKLGKLILTK